LRVEVVLVAGYVARVAAFNFPDRVRITVPNGFALAIHVPRAFHLLPRSGRPPKESVRK
jgi:dUTPase